MLRLGDLEDLSLPSVVGLLADAVFLAPFLYIAATVPTFPDPPGPECQFILLVDCL